MAMTPQQVAWQNILAQTDPAAAQSYTAHFATAARSNDGIPAGALPAASRNDGIPAGALPTASRNDGIPAFSPAQIANTPGMGVTGIGTSNFAAPAVSDQAVTSWLQSNPGASDATIAASMNQFGVTPDQMARVTGLDTGAVEARYNAALPSTTAATTASAPDYGQLVRDAYASIGRTGIGTEAANIDQAGFDNWVNALQSGSINPTDLTNTFRSSVADYLIANPEDKYSSYVTDFLSDNRPAAVSEIVDLYRDVLGRAPDAAGLGNWYKQFGEEVSQEERDAFKTSAQKELDSRVQGLYTDFLGRDADTTGMEYWRNQFGSTIDDTEREQFRQSAAAEVNKQFGVTDAAATAAPTTEGILSGFKYANDSGITEDKLKKTLGEDVFNTYKEGFADYAKTGIANILADDKLSFDEARTAVKFGRDYGYDAQKMADLTGTDKRVFETIYKNYDDTTNKIVDSVLGAEDVKTNDDKIVKALALQSKFGFTDDDLAKAADFTPAQVKELLDPVRNFGTDLNKILSNTDSTLTDTKEFIEAARTNGAITQLYGDNINTLDTKIAEIEDRWKGFENVEPMHAQRVYDQLGGQRKAIGDDRFYRGVFADPLTMAATLARKGIDTLADIVQKDKFEAVPAEKIFFAPDGSRVYDLGNGTFGVSDGVEGYTSTIPKNQVKTTYGYTEYETSPDGESQIAKFVPLSDKDVDKDGNYERLLGKVAIDKDTGEEIAGLDGKIASQSSSGGLRKKQNDLNVTFTKEGVPVITASSQKSGLGALVQDLAPMLSMALPFILPGVGSALSSMLPGAGVAASGATAAIAPTLLNQALTQGIISGGLTTLGGGQFEKGFLSGAVTPVVNTGISSLLPAGMNPDLAKSLTSAGTGAVRGAIGGGDFTDILKGGITQGLADYGVNTALGASGLTPQQLNFITGIAAPLLQGEKINPVTAFGTLVNAGQQQTQRGNSNTDFGGGSDIDELTGGAGFDDTLDSGSFGYNQPFDQQSLNNIFTGNGPSNFYGANMAGNSNDQSLVAQFAQMVSQGLPLGGGYIKPARVGRGYGARWSKQFNEGGMVDAGQKIQGAQS
jgi:hypothetical protein